MSERIILILLRYLMFTLIFGVTTYLVVALDYTWACFLIALIVYAIAEGIYDDFRIKVRRG